MIATTLLPLLVYCCVCLEMICPQQSPPHNGAIYGTDFSYGSAIIIACLPGYMLADRNLSEKVWCISVGSPKPVAVWSSNVHNCQGLKSAF